MEKVVILGAGVAGLTSAIYTSRAGLKPLVISGYEPGQLTMTTTIENYPGFPDGVNGPDLVDNIRKQAEKFGAKIVMEAAKSIETKDGIIIVETDQRKIETMTLIIATGGIPKWLGVPGEQEFKGKGVHTCATCDGFFYKGKEVFVIGGGDSSCEEAEYLAKIASKVTMLIRRDEMRASKIMQERVKRDAKINIMWSSEIVELKGEKKLEKIIIKNTKDGLIREFKADGVFLAIGYAPNSSMFKGMIDMDENGFIKADKELKTNIPGVFAAGDVQDPIHRQAVAAAGYGCIAGIEVRRYVEEHSAKKH